MDIFIEGYAWVWILFVFVAYFAVLIGIAVFQGRNMRDMSDYVLGGRRIGVITSALSSGSSATSGWTMLVFPALAFTAGMMHLWTVLAIVLGIWLSWAILARRLRRYTIATDNSLTIPEFLEKRFGDTTGILRSLSSFISLYFITLYVCSGLIAGAKLLDEVFGAGHDIGVIVSLIAIVSYTFIGGFLAVSRTDVFQSMVMLSGFIIIPVTLLLTVSNPFQGIESTPEGFWNPFTGADNQSLGFMFFLSSLGWALGALGAQRMLSRFMAVDREANVNRSRDIGGLWLLIIFGLGLLMGLLAAPALIDRGEVLPDAERLYLVVSKVFFHPVVAGLLLTAVIAAVMSTADSQLLLASAIATDDLPLIRRFHAHAANPVQSLDGTRYAHSGGTGGGHNLHNIARVHLRPGVISLGRHGSGLRSRPDSGPLLASLQLLGSVDQRPVRRSDLHLVVADGPRLRPRRDHHRPARIRGNRKNDGRSGPLANKPRGPPASPPAPS